MWQHVCLYLTKIDACTKKSVVQWKMTYVINTLRTGEADLRF